MLIVSTENIPGRETVEAFGLVRGSTVRAKWFGKDIIAGLRNIVGGEIKEYTEMLEDAREQSINRMVADAERLGADAVVNVRFVTSHITQAASELLVYGTAVKLK
ncbi:MAG: YbjQ family protein [Candidatus Hydrothermarchaeales archaeon]